MGTAKRERQKANRARRQEELVKEANRARTTRIVVIVGGAIVAIFGLVFLVGQFSGDDQDTAPLDTIPDDDAPANAEPVATATGATAAVAPVDPAATTPPDPDPTDGSATDAATSIATEPGDETEGSGAPGAAPVDVPEQSLVDTEVVPDGCPPPEGTDEQNQQFAEAPPMCLDPNVEYTAVVTTNLGVVEWSLDQEQAPNTVNSFVFLARNGYFDGTVCHRIIQDFVVQCGDPTATGQGGPGYTTDDELPEAGQYEVGSIAMANSGPDTQGSQFFIITGDAGVRLPPQYSLFGQIPDDDLGVVAEMDARGSADSSGTPSAPVELIEVHVDTA